MIKYLIVVKIILLSLEMGAQPILVNLNNGLTGQALIKSSDTPGDYTWVTLTKAMVGLSAVDNTSDVNKPVSSAAQTALNAKQPTLVSGTNIKTVNGNSILGSGDVEITSAVSWGNVTGTLANQTDLNNALAAKLATNGNGSALTNMTASQVGLGNVTNESKATMFTSPTFTGTPVVPGYLPNTTTAGVGSSPTASSTVTITHNLGRVPAIIRIYGYGTFTSNAAATATTSSIGVFNSSGNFCVYQRFNTAAITTTQAGLSSNTFSILLSTGANSFISGVIQNVTSSSFDIVFTETGTATAQPYLWEAQEP